MSLVLYELGTNAGLRYSQFSWRTRMALAHKGAETEFRPVPVSDKEAIAFSGQTKVPILVDGDQVISDSWAIALHLEQRLSDAPSLFGCDAGRALADFTAQWVDRSVIPALAPLVAIDVVSCVNGPDAEHLRSRFEKAFAHSLEELARDRDQKVQSFRRIIGPARAVLRKSPFLSGTLPAYADYALFSVFQWARLVSTFEPLTSDDIVVSWRSRMLDLYDRLARSHPSRSERDGHS